VREAPTEVVALGVPQTCEPDVVAVKDWLAVALEVLVRVRVALVDCDGDFVDGRRLAARDAFGLR